MQDFMLRYSVVKRSSKIHPALDCNWPKLRTRVGVGYYGSLRLLVLFGFCLASKFETICLMFTEHCISILFFLGFFQL